MNKQTYNFVDTRELLLAGGYKPFWESEDSRVVVYGELVSGILIESKESMHKRIMEILGEDMNKNILESAHEIMEEFRKRFDIAALELQIINPNIRPWEVKVLNEEVG